MILHSDLIRIHESATIGSTSILGKKFRAVLEGGAVEEMPSHIGENVEVGEYCIIGSGVKLGSNAIIDDYAKIECNVEIGENTLIINGCQICCDVQIGCNCIIGN